MYRLVFDMNCMVDEGNGAVDSTTYCMSFVFKPMPEDWAVHRERNIASYAVYSLAPIILV